MSIDTTLTPELREWNDRIREYARDFGLDFFDTIFELVDHDEVNEIAAYGGFATRYPHWSHGMTYDQISKGYTYGVSKIYELVINNDPCYAFLMRGNELVAQKLVMAHVYAHSDFFKNNAWFKHTDRRMVDRMANHAIRIKRYIDRYGLERVERFLDACLSIDNLIDPFLPFVEKPRPPKVREEQRRSPSEEDDDDEQIEVHRFEAKDYMDHYINPPTHLEEERKRLKEARLKAKRFPERDEKDVLQFLIEYAPLTEWQRDILSIVRDEAYYFAPQRQTKIMNEGWASYWHSKIMTEKACDASEILQFAEMHAGTMAGGGALNPYKLGLELLRDIEYRWDTGRHGKAWEECDDLEAKANWDTGAMKGREKIFEVRAHYNDVTFIQEFLTEEFCERRKLFAYEYHESIGRNVISSREFEAVKQKLLFQLTNFGQPFVYVRDANFRNRGELLLWHKHLGVDMRRDYAVDTLKHLQRIWNRPITLATEFDGIPKLITHDGEAVHETDGLP